MAFSSSLDARALRRDFPVLENAAGEPAPIYLDSAATSLKPRRVIETLSDFYSSCGGGVNRSVYRLARETSARYREARERVADLVLAESDEIVFVRHTTEAINLVAAGHPRIRGGKVLATLANHHSALLPWGRKGGQNLEPVALTPDGLLDLDDLEKKLAGGADLLCLPQVSNAFGLEMPIAEAVAMARAAGAWVLVDGAQSVPHRPVDVLDLGADFLCWSGHKMLAPEGIGVLWARRELLAEIEPWLLGGDMVESVGLEGWEPKESPGHLEAGTPNVGGVVALGAAVDYLEEAGLEKVHRHVRALARRARERLREIEGLEVYGPESDDAVSSAVAFGFAGMAAHALALMLSNRFGIMVRSGYHCAQPYHEALGLGETVRASFYLYNTEDEVDALAEALETVGDSLPDP